MLEPKPSHGDQPVPRSRTPEEGPNRSEFEDLLRCASEVLRARAETEQGGLGTGNTKVPGQNE
jgi:hypothetical protein